MKKILLALALVLGSAIPTAAARAEQVLEDPGDPVESKAVRAVAYDFLNLVDAGRFDESWNFAGAILRATVTRDEWRQTLAEMRKKFGEPGGRELAGVKFTSKIDGAPQGHYYVAFYESVYGGKTWNEKVIFNRQGSDWKVEGYFIEPIEKSAEPPGT